MLRELQLILALSLLSISTTVCGQDTVDVNIFRLVPDIIGGESSADFAERLQSTCATNSFPPGVVIRFDNSLCPGPFILSPIFDRSTIAFNVVAADEILLSSSPYTFNADETRRWYVHCGTGYKTNSICIDIDPALLPNPAQAIPTLSIWGIIILSLMISILFPLTLRKRIYHLN